MVMEPLCLRRFVRSLNADAYGCCVSGCWCVCRGASVLGGFACVRVRWYV